MKLIFVIFEVSKDDKSNSNKDEQLANIEVISSTKVVLILLKFTDSRDTQP